MEPPSPSRGAPPVEAGRDPEEDEDFASSVEELEDEQRTERRNVVGPFKVVQALSSTNIEEGDEGSSVHACMQSGHEELLRTR